jgi:protein TonB
LVYPEIARKAGVEGTVQVRVLISPKGEIIKIELIKSLGNNGCDEAAIKAIKSVKWNPAYQRDQPVQVWLSVSVRFKLK